MSIAVRVALPEAADPPVGTAEGPWLVAAIAPDVDPAGRATFGAEIGAPAGRLVVRTCHRVELYGVGSPPGPADDLRSVPGMRFLAGGPAARHLLRLAAGLESAAVGEDQVLGQVRAALAAARAAGPLDPRLGRLVEIALRTGRLARAGGSPPAVRSMAGLAVAALERTAGPLRDRAVLLVGAGTIARAIAHALGRAGAGPVVASRNPERARRLAGEVGGEIVELGEAARRAAGTAGVVVALGGPWQVEPDEAALLPPVIDLSAPSALAPSVRAILGARFTGIDDLAPGRALPAGDARAATAAWVARAEALVAEAEAAYRRWLGGRAAVDEIRVLRERAEERRAREVAAILRRLPDLDPRARAVVEQHSRRLVAGLLHAPLARLGEDGDGDAAAAARRLYGP